MPVQIGKNSFNQWPIRIPDATATEAGVMSPADKAKLDGLTPGGVTGFVSGIVTQQMGATPVSLSLPGAVVGMTVIQALGQNGSTKILQNQASEFESVITIADHIQQTGGPSGSGTVSILLSQS